MFWQHYIETYKEGFIYAFLWYRRGDSLCFIYHYRTVRSFMFFFIYTKTWLPPLGCQTSPSQAIELEKTTHLLIHSLVLKERCHRIGCQPLVWRHRSGCTQAPPTRPHCISGVPPEAPNPFLHRVESVSRSTLYQSYYSISHSPLHIPFPTPPLCFL